jgi:putative FmdB family regulatory protein
MPVYEYQCSSGHTFDAYATIEHRHDDQTCPDCGAGSHKVILHAPRVFGDYEGYVSPASGNWIEGRRARQEDLRRTGCRPWEGMESESRAANERQQAVNKRFDATVDDAVERSMNELTS